MVVRRTVTRSAVDRLAPGVAASAVRQLVHRAIDGFARFPGARQVAQEALSRTGDVEAAVDQVIERHVRLSGAQGFVTGLGGLVATPIALPANLTGLGLLQVRMVAAIAHLHGYDLAVPGVRLACLVAVIGEDDVERLVADRKLPGRPRELANQTSVAADLVDTVCAHVGANLVSRVGGKRLALTVTRRVPLLGGGVGALVDGFATHQVGRYAQRELRPRTVIERA